MTGHPAGATSVRRLRLAAQLLLEADRRGVALSHAGTFLAGAAPALAAWLAKLLIDELTGAGRASTGIWVLAAALALTMAAGQASQAWLGYLEARLGRRVELVVQDRLFRKLNEFTGLAPFEQPQFHNRVALAQRGGQMAPQVLVGTGTSLLQGAVTLAGFLGALTAASPLVAALVLVAAAPQLVAELRLAGRRIEMEVALSPMQRRRFFYSRLQVEPQSAKELRLFGLGDFFHGRMLRDLTAVHSAEEALDRRVLRVQGVLDLLSAALVTLAVAAGVRGALEGSLTPGTVALLLAALPVVTTATASLVDGLARGAHALLMVQQYRDLLDLPSGLGTGLARPAAPLVGQIVLDDVWFRYGDHLPWVLRGVTLRISRGSSIGLVGVNGAGKSTIVKLLGRLCEPTRGRILWDGVDIRDLDPATLRARIGTVSQDSMAYDLTAAENVGVGDLARLGDRPGIRSAAGLAGVAEAIEGLPDGYDTVLSRTYVLGDVEEDAAGVLLSGGQWQRIALARMLLRSDRDLLVLDEPASGLDPEAEHRLNLIVDELTSGRTRLLVSHRLSAVRMSDTIVVIEDGVVAEHGSHSDLMARDGRYAAMFRTQAAGYGCGRLVD